MLSAGRNLMWFSRAVNELGKDNGSPEPGGTNEDGAEEMSKGYEEYQDKEWGKRGGAEISRAAGLKLWIGAWTLEASADTGDGGR